MHMDSNFTDTSACAVQIGTSTPSISTAQKKFGAASGFFNGTNGEYAGNGSGSPPDCYDQWWYFGNQDFTIDMWVYMTTVSAFNDHHQTFASDVQDATNRMRFSLNDTQGLIFDVVSGGNTLVHVSQNSTHGWNKNTWYHVAVVRYGNTWTIYRNGTALASQTASATYPWYTAGFEIGGEGNTRVLNNGYIDEARVSKVARWTANFTPPTTAYSP